MASTAKLALKAHVADWLAELDACYEMREVWHPEKARVIEQRVLVHPPLAKHTGTLHRLIQADYSSLIPKSEMDEYRKKLEANGHRVPLERSSFQAGYRWAIIKKWDRWKKLRVVERIANYEKDVVTHWEQFWGLHGGAVSPYTREWIQYENLIDAHRCVFGEPDEKQYSRWDSQFPAVAVMRRIEGGEPSRGADIVVLEKWASPWCKEHVFAGANELIKRLSSLEIRRAELREEGIDRLREQASALFAAVLAQDIQARHQRAMVIVRSWNEGWGPRVAGYFRTLGNADFIRHLRKLMPMLRVGDPGWEQSVRIKQAKLASDKRKASRVAEA